MLGVINLDHALARFDDLFAPKIVAELNGQHVKLAHLEGDAIPWHAHDREDELFLVVAGRLEILTRDETVTLGPGEMTVVPRGVEHRVIAHEHVHLLLFEPAGIRHTGDVTTAVTRPGDEWLDL